MNNERGKTWKEAALPKFKVLSPNLPDGTEVNQTKGHFSNFSLRKLQKFESSDLFSRYLKYTAFNVMQGMRVIGGVNNGDYKRLV